MDAIAPPFYRKQTGRPKKLRRRGVDEPINPYKVSRRNKGVTCAKCLQLGHNQRSCKGPIHPKSKEFKGKASHSQGRDKIPCFGGKVGQQAEGISITTKKNKGQTMPTTSPSCEGIGRGATFGRESARGGLPAANRGGSNARGGLNPLG
ncbi:uncharacterized protein LOC130750474 [Actinidia eriantha]|uniref:uncharacterized protein LOC130750474 n=1 Tax=Actinidia eriantha TaxID=165200 RepID=UPI00258C527E|nr:uncharacterized protein LOC130750474 [Actinidia eriantha]